MRQPYILRTLKPGTLANFSGKLSFWGKKRAMSFPQFEVLSEGKTTLHTGGLISRYPETDGLSSKWIRTKIHLLLNSKLEVNDFLIDESLNDLSLLNFRDSLTKIHKPESEEDSETGRQRLAFNELLMHQIETNLEKIKWQQENTSTKLIAKKSELDSFMSKLPFDLTASQKRSVEEILKDLAKNYPMNRLLEGDVGSGKTVVAAAAIFTSFLNKKNSLIMAPTQILATQHYETLSNILKPFNIRTALATSGVSKTPLGNADLVIGTHALLFREEFHQNVGFVVLTSSIVSA